MSVGNGNWRELAAAKRKEQQDSIPREWVLGPNELPSPEQTNVMDFARACGLLSSHDLEITDNEDAEILLDRVKKGEWTAVEVTTAYYKRAIVAHQVTNCLTEIYVDKALAWAKDLDDHLAKTGEVVGPLHGLPISLKDQFCIEGLDTTIGYTAWIGMKAAKHCTLVDILLAAGAVPFVRTNLPQTIMWPETYNLIFGRTLNPHNRTLTSGGSSGGEGALISFKGSILGVGTDVGGSVRIPASCCGIYGMRPTARRIPYRGACNSLLGQQAIPSVAGPLSSSLNGLKIFMKTVVNSKPWLQDPLVIRQPWNEDLYRLVEHGDGKNICFGFIWDEGNYESLPPVKRAMRLARDVLIAAGHTVIDWAPGDLHTRISQLASAVFNAVGELDYQRDLAPTGEPLLDNMIPQDEPLHKDISIEPTEMKEPVDTKTAEAATPVIDAYSLWRVHKRIEDIRIEFLDRWNDTLKTTGTGRPVDALISPTAPYPAPPHGMNLTAQGTNIWNVLDYPVAVVPVTKFRNALDKVFYDMSCTGVLQIIGRTQEDEAVIALAEVLDNALRSVEARRKKP
ncbi:general amidase [Auriculariales sp. MPI-PUGE-AT-0066]|nr:general amidase [Auriculariales sp. MPI-PUGE-AT-0066]